MPKASLKEILNCGCPDCGEPPGKECKRGDGTIKVRPHKHRVNVAEGDLRERIRRSQK